MIGALGTVVKETDGWIEKLQIGNNVGTARILTIISKTNK